MEYGVFAVGMYSNAGVLRANVLPVLLRTIGRGLLLLPSLSPSLKGVMSVNQCACLLRAGALSFSAVQLPVMEKVIRSLRELEAEAARFAESLVPRGQDATFVTLSGELGAGKTAFVKAVAKAFGIEEIVTSPTFVLEKIYLLPHELRGETPQFVRLVHIDAYRLEKDADLALLGFDELMRGTENLILLEWPEKVVNALPIPTMRISLVMQTDGSRLFSYG